METNNNSNENTTFSFAPFETQVEPSVETAVAEVAPEPTSESTVTVIEPAPTPETTPKGKLVSDEEYETLQKSAAVAQLLLDPEKSAILTTDYDKIPINQFIEEKFLAQHPYIKADNPNKDYLLNQWFEKQYPDVDLSDPSQADSVLEHGQLLHEFEAYKTEAKAKKQEIIDSVSVKQVEQQAPQADPDEEARFNNASKEFVDSVKSFIPTFDESLSGIESLSAEAIKQAAIERANPDFVLNTFSKFDESGKFTGFNTEQFTKVVTALHVYENLPKIVQEAAANALKSQTQNVSQLLQNKQTVSQSVPTNTGKGFSFSPVKS